MLHAVKSITDAEIESFPICRPSGAVQIFFDIQYKVMTYLGERQNIKERAQTQMGLDKFSFRSRQGQNNKQKQLILYPSSQKIRRLLTYSHPKTINKHFNTPKMYH